MSLLWLVVALSFLPRLEAFSSLTPLPTATTTPPSADIDASANPEEDSRALASFLKNENDMSIPTFFKTIWQQSPCLFRAGATTTRLPEEEDRVWNEQAMKVDPYQELIRQGWTTLTDLLEQPLNMEEPPMVIHNGHVQHPQDYMPAYQTTSLYAPYLNGSSVMQAHADCLSPWLAAFCQDLQKTFPYVYANTYLTPPQSRALDLHADDREVFVVQLVGSKEWQVMKEVPIPHPYPHEQVGKGDVQVPQQVLEGGTSIACTLQPGDVLYIPRGHCHRAQCTDDLSFHVTIAVATFDWSLAGMIHMASKSILASVPDYKKGLLPRQTLDEQALQQQIDHAMQLLHQKITPQAVWNNLEARIEPHRQRALVQREQQLERARLSESYPQSAIPVGPLAARHIDLDTNLRLATDEERNELQNRPPLIVRNELEQDVQSILAQLESNPASLLKLKSDPARSPVWCDLTWLGFAKQAVESGVLAVAD